MEAKIFKSLYKEVYKFAYFINDLELVLKIYILIDNVKILNSLEMLFSG